MHRFILKRLYYGLFVLFGVITLVFLLFNVLPGDPARMMLGQRADMASVEAINRELGLDRPLMVQYLGFLNDLSPVSLHSVADHSSMWFPDSARYAPFITLVSAGDARVLLKKPYLRRSYQSKRKVSEIISQAFPNTMLLALVAMGFAAIAGIFTGIVSAVRKGSWIDRVSLIVSVFGMSLPSFFAAILMAWIFAFVLADFTGLNMFGSLFTVDDFGRGEYLDLKNLILPALTLGIRPLAVISGLTRNSMLEVLSQDYIRTARAKGLSYYRVITRHALRNALNPVVTAVSGWFASLMAGAVFVEYVFDWKGIGVVIVNGLEKYDFPVVMGAVLFIAVMLVIINIFVDIIYGLLDPRVRLA
ncbi:ABC-type dipeptide/oligopeptide/nickel transport system, permease component [Lentimicrobium saccharophilum]|uniref:Glutathione transport system permease protein GsiC n=1 Tax=Lentimicrobium saccharophilum TaxID=1678841 RepID=A0A0S7C091_9BACT|nr:ABC transporter permease [Lentimicrobium saccharophilum]GAP42560.1 ABC-type dipeptide/oligopeptide/nickel transport system, permease component [Lentimicrobium saccharophilum]